MKETFGIWRILPSFILTDILSRSGIDFQFFDLEHGSYDFKSLGEDIKISKLNHIQSFVRVGGLNQYETQKALDLGADGIIFPQLEEIDEFNKASKMVHHHPEGIRGYNPFVSDYGYGDSLFINRKKCIVIIETLNAVKNIDSILKMKNIDEIYIGVYDLSTQFDCKGDLKNQRLVNLVDEIIVKCQSNNKKTSLMINLKEDYQYYYSKGVRSFVIGVDTNLINRSFKKIISSFE